jgi:hypothetical protein
MPERNNILISNTTSGVNMKTLLATLFVLTTLSPAMASLTFSEILLKKDLKNTNGINFTAHTTVKTFCARRGNAFDVGSFASAQFLDGLSDGLYRCFGEFAKLPGDPVRAFKIDRCEVVNADDLNQNCDKP